MNLSSFLRRGSVLGAFVAAGLVAGCGDDAESVTTDVAGLADRTLTWAISDVDVVEGVEPAGAHRVTIEFSLASGGICSRLADGATATFNGQAMTLKPGGINGTAGRDVCEPTRAFIDVDPNVWAQQPVEDARIVLKDGSGTVSLVIQGGKTKRRFAFQGAGSADRLARGQTYSYLWEPDTETPGGVTVTLLREGGTASATVPSTQEGGLVTFTIPASTPVANHLLTLSGSVGLTALECTGVSSCTGSAFHSEGFIVTIQ
ncbi:hypothetical protein JY651_33635 [Pyxidicoccus parkwayensis]|uniref:Lipoprotein n=1 Tax=Pyxidicoccus parkwayensis TaxID=2813578 RepID=A0ABX7NMV7_9BACT|nr:hypothetical protein [Pyxidicoccus parkwaysis]QSQ20186.1 hypothetical protein JY651_33635 [Pyxidicoccus parkwaysis]